MPIFLVFATVKSSEGYRILKKKKRNETCQSRFKKKKRPIIPFVLVENR
jgi:hypothetical protein